MRKMERKIFALAAGTLAMLWAAGCFRPDIRTIAINVPQMDGPDCVKIVQDALGSVEGIISAQPDTATRTIAVTYDARKLGIRNVEFVIAGAGFDANDIPGRPEARQKLPPPCRD